MAKNSIYLSKIFSRIIILIFYLLLISINCRIIIPFKYLKEKTSEINTPKEIMTAYMNEKIYIKLELGSPKQEIQIPLAFNEDILYILNKESSNLNNITNKKYDNTKSSTFKTLSEDMEFDYNYNFNMYQYCSDIFYFLKDSKKKKYNSKKEIKFIYIFDGKTDTLGGFGLQIYPEKDDEKNNMPCPLKLLNEIKINNNYLWSIYFSKKGNNMGDEGYLLLGDYPNNIDYNLGYYDRYEFDQNNYRTIYDISNQKTMNLEVQMSEIYFYSNKKKKDETDQSFFNNLKIKDFSHDIIIPQVSVYYVTIFNYNFGGILVPEYFNSFLRIQVFDSYINSGECFTEKVSSEIYISFYYCKKGKIINKIKEKIPTILFIQEHLKYNFTINVNDLIYQKDDYVYFLLFSSSSQKNKWTLGKPFLKKYPLIFDPDSKNIGFYSSFLLTGIKSKTVIIIAVIFSVIFIIIGLLIGRKKYKIHKIKKQQALEMTNNNFISDYKSIEMKNNSIENKLYQE